VPLNNASYVLGALRDVLLAREAKVVDAMVLHFDSNQLDPMAAMINIARISELRGLMRDLEREARQEIDRIGRAADGAS
jgi:hypothetical protein